MLSDVFHVVSLGFLGRCCVALCTVSLWLGYRRRQIKEQRRCLGTASQRIPGVCLVPHTHFRETSKTRVRKRFSVARVCSAHFPLLNAIHPSNHLTSSYLLHQLHIALPLVATVRGIPSPKHSSDPLSIIEAVDLYELPSHISILLPRHQPPLDPCTLHVISRSVPICCANRSVSFLYPEQPLCTSRISWWLTSTYAPSFLNSALPTRHPRRYSRRNAITLSMNICVEVYLPATESPLWTVQARLSDSDVVRGLSKLSSSPVPKSDSLVSSGTVLSSADGGANA